ncbi:MAG: hypothetical protein AAFO96_29240, partial [Bacteroidota bacterium]
LTVDQVCEKIGISRQTVYKVISRNTSDFFEKYERDGKKWIKLIPDRRKEVIVSSFWPKIKNELLLEFSSVRL